MKKLPLVTSFVLLMSLCVSLTYWGLAFFKPAVRAMVDLPVTADALPAPTAAAGLLGGQESSAAVASNIQLKGVVVANRPEDSLAILVVDGKPAQALRLNADLQPGVTLVEVQRQYVVLSEAGLLRRLALPEASKANGMNANGATVAPLPTLPAPAPMLSAPVPVTSPR